jgi:hypothetical protein
MLRVDHYLVSFSSQKVSLENTLCYVCIISRPKLENPNLTVKFFTPLKKFTLMAPTA